MTTTIRMAHRGRTHWVQLYDTWCGRAIRLGAATIERTHEEVRQAIAAGSWCKNCADGWWMAVGIAEERTKVAGPLYPRGPILTIPEGSVIT